MVNHVWALRANCPTFGVIVSPTWVLLRRSFNEKCLLKPLAGVSLIKFFSANVIVKKNLRYKCKKIFESLRHFIGRYPFSTYCLHFESALHLKLWNDEWSLPYIHTIKAPDYSGLLLWEIWSENLLMFGGGLVSLEPISDVLHRAVSGNSVKTLVGSRSL